MKKAITVLGLGAAAVAISVSNASAMEQQNTSAVEQQDAQTTTGINLREQPGATSNKVSELQAGSKITVKESNNGWVNVQTDDGKSGWVSGYYVSDKEGNPIVSNNAVNNTDSTPAKKAGKEVVNNKDTKIIDSADYNQGNKAKSTTNIKESSSDVVVNSNAKVSSSAYLNIRVGPSVSNGISGVVYKGEIFKVVSKSSNGWYKVVLKDGTTGWASGKYISLTAEQDKTNITDYTQKNTKQNAGSASQGRVNSSVGLNIRSGAGTGNSVIGTLANNATVNIIGEENGWYKIKLANGRTGYVGANYISKLSGGSNIVDNASNSNVKGTTNPETEAENNKTNTAKSTVTGNKVVDYAQKLLGTKYVWGGTSTQGFDCSGFTQYVYKKMGINIPRVSRAQASAGRPVSLSNIKPGDLLYFDTNGSGTTSHVGIYMGNGKFIHASGTATNPERVKVSNMSEGWVKCLGARRF
nr:C40 family peptidase [uncultured Peptostreptococcus sp.]